MGLLSPGAFALYAEPSCLGERLCVLSKEYSAMPSDTSDLLMADSP